MELRLLGPVELVVDGRSRAVAGAGERAVLVLLVLSAGRVVAADTLVDALWGSGLPRNPANALQVRVSKLRRVLARAGPGEGAVRSRPPGYVLEVDPERVDAHRFVRLVGEGRSARRDDPERSVALYRAALDLWSGPAIAEFAGESWAQPDAVRLEGLRDAATEELFDLLVAGDVTAGLVGEIEAAVARRPRHERLYGQLMIALYRGGRQADALAVYRRAREMLRAELGLDPSVELRGIEQRILRQDPDVGGPQTPNPPAGPTPSPPPRLPVRLSSFVGRAADSARLADLVSRHRLVTVTGPGGVGKTSMAIEFARGTAAGEVWLVRLAGVGDGELVARAVADALGVRDDPGAPAEVRLAAHLRDRSGLLLLDNCEHVADACAVLAEQLLSSCPRLRLLATSREPLAVSGEVQYALAPLPAPDVDVAAEEVADFAAAQLFLERARSVLPGFAPDAASMLRLADICRRLDGIPLAIELAAAGVKALPVEDIAERLGTTFPALAGGPRTAEGRDRTLRAAVDWSHRLLTEPEQVLFRRLSVFRGGWDLRAAEQVASGGALGRDEVLE